MWPEGSNSERVRRLQSVTDAALAHLRLDDLLAALLDRTREILEVDTCAILLLDEETNELVARAALGIEEEVEQGVRVPVGGGFAGRIAAEKRPVILDDVDHAHVLNPILREKGIKSMLGVPLVVEGDVRGVLHVGSLHLRDFQKDEVELLQLVADRAALAIEHARLFEAERAARERIEHVQAVTDAALAHLEVNELLNVLLPRIRDILRTDTCAVLLLDEETNELVARAALGIEEEVGVRIPVGAGFAGRVADEARPMVIDVDEYPVYNPILREKQLKSMVGVPLLVRGESLGVLHVGTLTPRIFTHDEVELLQLVAERVAIAIERAQLHEELIQLDQLKLNFVSVASHELRTPATSVYGVLKTLFERGPDLNEELREELLRVGVEQGERLRSLLEELLDLSRLDARAITVEPRPVVLKSALADVVHGALASSDAVDLDIPDDLAAVVDPLVLERVISNLVANAVRYGAPPIRIVAQQRDRHLRVAVEDAGPGVPKDLEGRIFDRFARGGGESGHGLGLAIARAYAQAHGGDLIYDARPSGARFELLIPQERNGLSKPAGLARQRLLQRVERGRAHDAVLGQALRDLEPLDRVLRRRPVVAVGRARREAECRERPLQGLHLRSRVAGLERLGRRRRRGVRVRRRGGLHRHGDVLHRRCHRRRRRLPAVEDARGREDRKDDGEAGEPDDRDLRHRQRPPGDHELALAGRAIVRVLRQDPHFVGVVLVDAAIGATLRLGRQLGLVEPVVVPGAAAALREPPWPGPYRVRRGAAKPYNVAGP